MDRLDKALALRRERSCASVLRDVQLVAVRVAYIELEIAPGLIHQIVADVDTCRAQLALDGRRVFDVDLQAARAGRTVWLER